jgi:hypothetical protein
VTKNEKENLLELNKDRNSSAGNRSQNGFYLRLRWPAQQQRGERMTYRWGCCELEENKNGFW